MKMIVELNTIKYPACSNDLVSSKLHLRHAKIISTSDRTEVTNKPRYAKQVCPLLILFNKRYISVI